MNWQPTHPAVQQLIHALRAETGELYLVGGAVRDILLSRAASLKDLDFVVHEPALAIGKRVADRLGWAYYPLDEDREVARVLFSQGQQPPIVCDLSRVRGDSIEADLLARDFTINALALTWNARGETELIDVCGGRNDLGDRILRRVSPVSLAEDQVRLLRAPRFVAQFNLRIDSETEAQIIRLARTVQLASPERVRDELWKALSTPRPVLALSELRRLGLLPHVLPEVAAMIGIEQSSPHHEDVYDHTLRTVAHAATVRDWLLNQEAEPAQHAQDAATLLETLKPLCFRLRQFFQEQISSLRLRADWLVWHALLHDVGKPATRSEEPRDPLDANSPPRYRFLQHENVGAQMTGERLTAFRFSRHEISLARATVEGHMRPHLLQTSFGEETVSRRAAYRFYRDVTLTQAGQIAGFDILLLALCDFLAIHPNPERDLWRSYTKRIHDLFSFGFEQLDRTDSRHTPLVDGRIIMRHFNLKPGPHIGAILANLHEAQATGEISSVEEALALAGKDIDSRLRVQE